MGGTQALFLRFLSFSENHGSGGGAVGAAGFQSLTAVKLVVCLDLLRKKIFFDPRKYTVLIEASKSHLY